MCLHRRTFRMVGIATLLIAAFCLTGGVAAQEECEASVEATLESSSESSRVKKFQFRVDVRVDNECAHIEYDLIIEEQLPNGHTKKIRKPEFAKLNDGSFAAVVEHSMSSDIEMLDYRVKIVRCQPCEIMP